MSGGNNNNKMNTFSVKCKGDSTNTNTATSNLNSSSTANNNNNINNSTNIDLDWSNTNNNNNNNNTNTNTTAKPETRTFQSGSHIEKEKEKREQKSLDTRKEDRENKMDNKHKKHVEQYRIKYGFNSYCDNKDCYNMQQIITQIVDLPNDVSRMLSQFSIGKFMVCFGRGCGVELSITADEIAAQSYYHYNNPCCTLQKPGVYDVNTETQIYCSQCQQQRIRCAFEMYNRSIGVAADGVLWKKVYCSSSIEAHRGDTIHICGECQAGRRFYIEGKLCTAKARSSGHCELMIDVRSNGPFTNVHSMYTQSINGGHHISIISGYNGGYN